MKKILSLCAVFPLLFSCSSVDSDKIIEQLTLEEKVGMLHGATMFSSGGVDRIGIPPLKYADGPFGIREELQDHSWAPVGLTTDSATFFPTGSALAATWSEEAAYLYGKGMAQEARTRGKDMILGPAVNIQRIPTGGRTYEYLSEDPYLSSRITVGYIKGVQENGAAACVKHFAVNNQENNRGSVDAVVSERALREIYLAPFRAAVCEAGALGVMAAYNKVNGSWCAENKVLLSQILRDEWAFRGVVISDWGGTHSTVDAALNGLDVEMPGDTFFGDALIEAVQNGDVPEDVIDNKVRNLLYVRERVPAIDPDKANKKEVSTPEHLKMVYDIALQSVVLLKNDKNALPLELKTSKGNKLKIAIIGETAAQTNALGGIGAGVKAKIEVTPLQGLKDRIGDLATIVYEPGYTSYTAQDRMKGGVLGGVVLAGTGSTLGAGRVGHQLDEERLNAAKAAAQDADVVLFFAGDNREIETEGADRTNIYLPSMQDQLLKELEKVNSNIITVVVAGAPLDLRNVDKLSKAVVLSWFNGSESGHALADILLGKVSPSGRLPFTFPATLNDSPAYALKAYPATEKAVYKEDIYVGYRWFDAQHIRPLYVFGHGLTYTTFEYSNLEINGQEVSFTLKNTGKVEATEVVQLYVHRKTSKSGVEWPDKELKAFKRVTLKPGDSSVVTLVLAPDALQYWDSAAHAWATTEDPLEFRVGSTSADIRLTSR